MFHRGAPGSRLHHPPRDRRTNGASGGGGQPPATAASTNAPRSVMPAPAAELQARGSVGRRGGDFQPTGGELRPRHRDGREPRSFPSARGAPFVQAKPPRPPICDAGEESHAGPIGYAPVDRITTPSDRIRHPRTPLAPIPVRPQAKREPEAVSSSGTPG